MNDEIATDRGVPALTEVLAQYLPAPVAHPRPMARTRPIRVPARDRRATAAPVTLADLPGGGVLKFWSGLLLVSLFAGWLGVLLFWRGGNTWAAVWQAWLGYALMIGAVLALVATVSVAS